MNIFFLSFLVSYSKLYPVKPASKMEERSVDLFCLFTMGSLGLKTPVTCGNLHMSMVLSVM